VHNFGLFSLSLLVNKEKITVVREKVLAKSTHAAAVNSFGAGKSFYPIIFQYTWARARINLKKKKMRGEALCDSLLSLGERVENRQLGDRISH
jgi:hypothetical protein